MQIKVENLQHYQTSFQGCDILKELFIDIGITESRAALFEDNKITGLYTENHDNKSTAGNIYLARVENVVEGLSAAFVNMGEGKNAILHFDEHYNSSNLKRGQQIIVQVIRESSGNKGPRVTANISLPGVYTVLLPGIPYKGISKKITDDKEKSRLDIIADEISDRNYGIILRTEASGISKNDITEDFEELKDTWNNIKKSSLYVKPASVLFYSRDFIEYLVREYVRPDIDKIYINRIEEKKKVESLVRKLWPEINTDVVYDALEYYKFDRINDEIDKLLNSKFLMNSGGFLVVNSTEAFTSIDVNSGSFVGSNQSETIKKINMEACDEIYRIVKLTNLSGIILIDFIDMNNEKMKNEVLERLKDCFKKDKQKCRIYGFTNLGLVEMSRAKKGRKLSSVILKDGIYMYYSMPYILKKIENECIKDKIFYSKNNYYIYLSSKLYDNYIKQYESFKDDMKKIYGINLNVKRSNFISSYDVCDKCQDEIFAKLQVGELSYTGQVIDFAENENEINLKLKKI